MSPTSELVPRTDAGASANWVWLSLIPMGLGSWAPAYAGSVIRRRSWVVLGVLLALVSIAGWVLSIADNGNDAAGGLLIILGWVGGFAASLGLRAPYKRALASDFELAESRGRARLAQRAQARQLARQQPALASEMGIGRPDIAGAQDAGLIDVNHCPASVLATLPGVDQALAERLVAARDELHGWSSLEDMGSQMDLDGNLVEDLRQRVVFLPR